MTVMANLGSLALVLLAPAGCALVLASRTGLGAKAYLVVLAFALAAGATPLAKWIAHRFGVVDRPGGRKVHAAPTPLLGGLAIFAGFAACGILSGPPTSETLAVFIAAALVFFIGVLDDIRSVSAVVRLVVQTVAVSVLITGGVSLTFLPPTWWGVAGEWALTFLWIVGITNAFNFIDGLDGLASGSAAVNAFFLGVYAFATEQSGLALLAFSLMAASLGFLPFNYKFSRRGGSAEIFLGDSGSTFLGFTLASLALMGNWAEGSPKDLIVPVLILAVPIFDMTLTTVVRFREGLVTNFLEWILYTGRDHFHHRLVGLGMRHKETTAVVLLVNACLGISALLLKRADLLEAFLALIQISIFFAILGYAMVVINARSAGAHAARTRADHAAPVPEVSAEEAVEEESVSALLTSSR